MIIADKLQNSVGEIILRRKYKKNPRNRFTHNLNSAENVGVIFAPANKEELMIVKGFLGFLTKLGIKVFPMAYIDTKKNDIETVLEKSIYFINRKDFNWYNKPFTPLVKKFVNNEFDILINLCMHTILPVNFLIGQSKAKLKVCKLFENKETYCDLMIDITQSDNLSYLIEQISHYLSVINNAE